MIRADQIFFFIIQNSVGKIFSFYLDQSVWENDVLSATLIRCACVQAYRISVADNTSFPHTDWPKIETKNFYLRSLLWKRKSDQPVPKNDIYLLIIYSLFTSLSRMRWPLQPSQRNSLWKIIITSQIAFVFIYSLFTVCKTTKMPMKQRLYFHSCHMTSEKEA